MLHTSLIKRILPLVILISLMSFNGFSNHTNENGNIENFKANEWKLYKDVNGVNIYFKLEERHDIKHGIHKEYLLIQFQNTTNKTLELKWKDEMWYDDKCVNCESTSNEYLKSFVLPAGETKNGDCSENIFPQLRIHSKFLNYDLEELTKYEMVDIEVSPTK